MKEVTEIGTLIVCSPEVRAGRPRIAGTGVTVRRIVEWYKLGYNPEEIADQLGHVSLMRVYLYRDLKRCKSRAKVRDKLLLNSS